MIKKNSKPSELTVHVHFIEPFRMAPWFSKQARKDQALKWQRFQSFARWHKDINNGQGRPFITGYLLRSALFKAVEEELAFADGKWGDLVCCPGKYETENPKKGHPKRRRCMPSWRGKQDPCADEIHPDEACPLCLLMNRFKQNGVDNVHFGNLNLPGDEKDRQLWDNPEQIARLRTLNRIDRATTKAQDFFKIYEVADLTDFYGTITVNDRMAKADAVVSLLERGLGFVSTLCGAQCEIRLVNSFKRDISKNNQDKETDSQDDIVSPEKLARICSGAIAGPKLRTLADAIRLLRIQDPKNFALPLGRKKQDGSREPHHLWDVELKEKEKKQFHRTPFRTYLETIADKLQHNDPAFRRYCEDLGFRLFRLSKGLDQNQPGKGLAENIMDPAQVIAVGKTVKGLSKYRDPMVPKYEWIITGHLKAKTPFFIPEDLTDNDHTSRKMLLTSDLRYRLPRSLLRGILRRDLHEATGGQGCRAELAPETPCVCPVCRVMSRLNLYDAASFQSAPPDIRHRIKIAHHHGIVQDGALFDTEYGLEGTVFPFCLRYRGNLDTIDKELRSVLGWWGNGLLFLGGDFGTGKGCFELKDLVINRWDLAEKESRADYARHCGLRHLIIQSISQAETPFKQEMSEKHEGFETNLETTFPNEAYPWQKLSLKLHFKGPVLSADPIRALIQDDADTIFFQKRAVGSDGKTIPVPVLRGESLRGLFRTAVARASGQDHLTVSHADCTCLVCKSFGNEHQAGLIRFDDLEADCVSDSGHVNDKRIDHVSIDRFDASVVEKYDDRALIGSPDDTLVFKGSFWIHRDFSQKIALINGLKDLEKGLYSLGGKGGIGYGWVTSFSYQLPDDWVQGGPEEDKDNLKALSTQQISELLKPVEHHQSSNGIQWKAAPGSIYNPYYFIPPGKNQPVRTDSPFSHAVLSLSSDRFTGILTCRLKTRTPLLLPDTENPETETNGHTKYPFFRLGNTEMIPGSGIRSVVSQVYETLTDSCFRVMNQKRTLSWRMDTDDYAGSANNAYSEFFPGIVSKNKNGELVIQKADSFRLPLYDGDAFENFEGNDKYEKELKARRDKLQNAQKINQLILSTTRKNKEWLNNLRERDIDKYQKVIRGRSPVKFIFHKTKSPHDSLAELCDSGTKTGYIKITGPNNANVSIEKPDLPETVGCHEIEDIKDIKDDPVSFSLGDGWCFQVSNSKEYPRPKYVAHVDGNYYSINKRCERIFVSLNSQKEALPVISDRHQRVYAELVKESKEFTSHLAKPFKTKMSPELKEGDLVYFRTKKQSAGCLDAIIPVSLFRLSDDRLLGKRLAEGYEPCSFVCMEDCEKCHGKDCPVPIYREGYPVKGLCPACQLFGAQMYKGRVRFSFAEPLNTELRTKDVTLPLLERPRPTWVLPKPKKGNNADNQIPGRKFYLRHSGWKDIWDKGIEKRAGSEPKKIKPEPNNATIQGVEKDTEFSFNVGFENLTKEELGRLLYCLELENRMVHALGRGKPFGFGQIKIKVHELAVRKNADFWHHEDLSQKQVTQLKMVSESLTDLTTLQKVRLVMSPQQPDVVVHYPKLNEEGGIPGYEQLKEKGYDPNYCLTVQEKKGASSIFPWYPLPAIQKPASEKKSTAKKNTNHFPSGNKSPGKEKKQGSPALPPENSITEEGVVKWFNEKKGFGFIERKGKPNVFVHHKAIQCDGFKTLNNYEKVIMEVDEKAPKGPAAKRVWKIE
jgi:cold shock CspA family protein/CRISPR/Cas system CSM-associated protein Csm3 (group 7 of RAMP superfamily)